MYEKNIDKSGTIECQRALRMLCLFQAVSRFFFSDSEVFRSRLLFYEKGEENVEFMEGKESEEARGGFVQAGF